MFVCCECCVLWCRGLCDELITRPEESYRLWCVVVCDLENLKNEEAMTRFGSQRRNKKKSVLIDLHTGQPLTHSNYTRGCINTIVLLKMSTKLLETCRGFK